MALTSDDDGLSSVPAERSTCAHMSEWLAQRIRIYIHALPELASARSADLETFALDLNIVTLGVPA